MDTTQASETTVLSDLPDSVKEELIETVSTLKNLLDGNQEFFPKLISKSFEVAIKKNINMTDVEKLLYTEYPDLTNYEDGYNVLENTWDLVHIFRLNSKIMDKFLEENSITTHNGIAIIRKQMFEIAQEIGEFSAEEFMIELIGNIDNEG